MLQSDSYEAEIADPKGRELVSSIIKRYATVGGGVQLTELLTTLQIVLIDYKQAEWFNRHTKLAWMDIIRDELVEAGYRYDSWSWKRWD